MATCSEADRHQFVSIKKMPFHWIHEVGLVEV